MRRLGSEGARAIHGLGPWRSRIAAAAPRLLGAGLVALAWLTTATATAAPPELPPEPGERSPDPGSNPSAPDPETVELGQAVQVEPGATCLSHAALLEDLLSWRDDPNVDARVTLVVTGDARDPRALDFRLEVLGELAVERRFERAPRDCADLHAVVALAAAIALDDTLAGELGIVTAATPSPQPPARPGPSVQIGPQEGDLPSFEDPEPGAPSRRRPVYGVSAGAGMFAGFSPRLGAGGQLTFDLRPRDHFDIGVGALVTHQSGFALDESEVATTVAAGRVDLCWGTAPMVIRLRACAAFAAGATLASSSGNTTNFRRTIPWLAALAGVDVVTHLVGPLFLDLRVEGVFPLQKTHIEVTNQYGQSISSLRFPPVGLLVAVGPRLEF
ncbi:hypothetical protein G6O69_35535 [Pseudenhygromyxa sp. WMMC2535]|uniref:hypothetical protein n=1 Tax=Pseudenhygromyxa sp. WMMC2535 TaxID=2712867 RepID=UPI0015570CA1|nr:hypothetical protein [Pseudenhygromyxa sp. WMMC2535]NVB43191.1 hypothetical protein [Pseudenhygromyxa sp. WMMC2535]